MRYLLDTNMERTLVILKPCTVRGDLCVSHQENIIHASDSLETAKAELERFFSPQDYCDYPSPLFDYLYAQDEL